MIEEITNVTPENEQPLPETSAAEKKDKTEKKNAGKTVRGVAMGAALAGAAGAGAAVAHAMQPGDADEVVDEVMEVSPETAEASPFAQVFNHDDAKPVTPGRDGDTQSLREPELREDTPVHDDTHPVTPEDGEDLPLTPEDEITADEPADLPDFIEQPDMSEIEVHIDENIDMDDPLGSMETV